MKHFYIILLLLFSASLFAYELESQSETLCIVEGKPLVLSYYGPNWTGFVKANSKSLTFPGESGEKIEGKGFRRYGTFDVGVNGKFIYTEIKKNENNKVTAEVELSSEQGISCASLFFQMLIPLAELDCRPVIIDDRNHYIDVASLNNWRFNVKPGLHTVKLPMLRGILKISGHFGIVLQDNRKYGTNTCALRLTFPDQSGKIYKSKVDINVSYSPFPVQPLLLSSKSHEKISGGIKFMVPNNNLFTDKIFEIKFSTASNFLYLLSSLSEKASSTSVGKIVINYADGSSQIKEILSGIDTEICTSTEKPEKAYSFPIGNDKKIFLRRFPLSGKQIKNITVEACPLWHIAGITLSEHKLTPQFKDEKYVVKAGKHWKAYQGELDIEAGSALDFSELLDAPAGKYGFVKINKENFVFEKELNKSVRFWGTNLTARALFMNNTDIDRLVTRLARSGYNLVRIHHFDKLLIQNKENSTDLEPSKLDRLDYLLASCKKRGIYISLDLYTSRKTLKGEISDFPNRKLYGRDYKSLIIINDNVMKNLECFTKNLLTHKNPYTGLRWTDDPVIANVSLINEGVLLHNIRSEFVHDEYNKAFRKYLKKNPSSNRNNFMHDIYHHAYKRMSAFVHKLGVKVPLTDLNYTLNHIDTFFDRKNLDFLDIHYYWAHPNRLGVPRSFRPDSALNNFSGLSPLFGARFLDRPFAVSEWSFVYPNAFRSEGGFLAGAYFSLQGYSMLCRFNYASNPYRAMNSTIIVGFEQVSDPVAILSDRAGALFFLRRDVKESKDNCAVLIKNKKNNIPAEMQIMGMIYKTGCIFSTNDTANTKAVISLDAPAPDISIPQFVSSKTKDILQAMQKSNLIGKDLYDQDSQKINSATGELFFDGKNKTFMTITPRSEGFIVNPDIKLKGKFATVTAHKAFSSVLVASRDNAKLSKSLRILILHLTDCQNSDIRFSNSKRNTVENYGKLPVLLKRGTLDIELKINPSSSPELYTLSLSGKRLNRIPLKQHKNKFSVTLDNSKGIFAYELIMK